MRYLLRFGQLCDGPLADKMYGARPLQKDVTPTCLSSNPLFSGGKCLMTVNFGRCYL